MTDKARELLKKALNRWDDCEDISETYLVNNVMEEIRDFLSTPEPTQDEGPVAWMYPDDLERFETNETFAQAYSIKCGSPSQGTTEPLYRHPAPRPEFVRLSEVEVSQILSSAHTPYEAICAVENRLVEKNK